MSIVVQARVIDGRFSATVKLPGRQHEHGDRWTFTITYSGDRRLRPASVTGGFRLEVEHHHPATGGPYP